MTERTGASSTEAPESLTARTTSRSEMIPRIVVSSIDTPRAPIDLAVIACAACKIDASGEIVATDGPFATNSFAICICPPMHEPQVGVVASYGQLLGPD